MIRGARQTMAVAALSLCACGQEAAGGASGVGGSASGGQSVSSGGSGDGGSSGGGFSETGGATTGGVSSGGSASSGGAPSGGSSTGGASAGGSSSGRQGSGGANPTDVVPSPGCDLDDTPQSGPRTIDVGGTTREYIVSIADGSAGTPLPLVFGFHGLQYDAEWVDQGLEPIVGGPYFGMQAEAAGAALFVAPQALSGGWSNQDGRDVEFVSAMVEELTSQLCVDESRLFATGFSYGGIMTATIGCELSDIFRAVAPQSASLPDSCEDGLPALAYLGIHGTTDMTIQLSQGEEVLGSYLTRNGCSTTASAADDHGCVHYEGCSEGAPASFCTFEGAHVPSPTAGPALWEFFSQF